MVSKQHHMKSTKEKPAPLPAKTCYSHLGGQLGSLLMEAFIDKGWIARQDSGDKHFTITAEGERGFRRLGVDLSRLRP